MRHRVGAFQLVAFGFGGMWRLVRATGVALALCVGSFGLAGRAQAQFGNMSEFEIGANAVNKRSLEAYAKILGMDASQKEAALELLDGYREEHKKLREGMRSKMESAQEDMRDTGDWQKGVKEMQRLGVDFREKVEKLYDTFTTDVKALLTPKQLERWPIVERHRRRDTGLRFGFYSGAAADLVAIADRQGVNAQSEDYKAIVEQYEVEIDRHMQEWERQGRQAMEDAKKDENTGFNWERQQKIMQDMGAVSKQVRDINKTYLKRFGEFMTPEQREKFEKAYYERSYVQVFRRAQIQEQLDAALEMNDLDASQKQSLREIKAQYERDAAPLNMAWVKATDEAEDKAGGTFMVMMQRWGGGGEGKNDLQEARKARRELDDRVKKRLEEVLSEAQRERLPKRKATGNNPWDMSDMFPGLQEDDE